MYDYKFGYRSNATPKVILQMGLEAATKALLDAGITYDDVQAAYCGVSWPMLLKCRADQSFLEVLLRR